MRNEIDIKGTVVQGCQSPSVSKEVTLVTKKCQKSDCQFTKGDFFPIEIAAIVSLSDANRQEYEHLDRYFLYRRLFGSKGGAMREGP